MTEYVEFQDRVVQVFELKVGCNDVGVRVVCRMLHRGEVVDLVFARHDDDTAGVLTGRALDAEAACYQSVDFRAVYGDALILQIMDGEAVCRFVRKRADGACLESLSVTEQDLRKPVRIALYVAGEV